VSAAFASAPSAPSQATVETAVLATVANASGLLALLNSGFGIPGVLEQHRETGRLPDVTRLRICRTELKTRNHIVQQYDLRGSDDNLGICQNCTRIRNRILVEQLRILLDSDSSSESYRIADVIRSNVESVQAYVDVRMRRAVVLSTADTVITRIDFTNLYVYIYM
jgi:hypothetical protein